MYRTPSAANRNTYSDNTGPRSDADQTTREFNDSVELIFENIEDNGVSHHVDSASSFIEGPNTRLSKRSPKNLYELAREYTYDGNYRAAGQTFELASLRYTESKRPNFWGAVRSEFLAALMKMADFRGSPQSIVARFVQELSRFLVRERHKYNQADPVTRNLVELHKLLTSLKMSTQWASWLITQQRALQIWVPILGPEHPKIKMMRNNIATNKVAKRVNLSKETWRIEGAENMVPETFELDGNAHLRSIGNFLHLCDGSPDDLLHKFRLLENSDILGRQFQQEIRLLRYGRSMSMLGCYYSFLQQFDAAGKAFQESDDTCNTKLVWRLSFTVYFGMPSTKPEFETRKASESSYVKRTRFS